MSFDRAIHPGFHSRDEFLARPRGGLSRGEADAAAIVSTRHGMGGIGETRTAMEYGVRRHGEYTAPLFPRAADHDALERGLAGLAARPELPESEATEDAAKRAAVEPRR